MVRVAPHVVRVRAGNPSPMTLDGTNTYVIDAGGGAAIVVDPGPAIADHVDAIVGTAAELNLRIAAIAVTHGHPDHAPAALPLHERTGAPVYAHELARFPFDRALAGGDAIGAGPLPLLAIDAPGHARDHLVFWFPEDRVLFTGDVVVGAGTVVISPPGGDMRAYLTTLRGLRERYGDAYAILGGHGEPVLDPAAKLDDYIAQRRRREASLLSALADGERTIPDLVAEIYDTVPRVVWPAAARQVLAHLIALEDEGRVTFRDLERAPTTAELAVIDPDLSAIVDATNIPLAAAEFGIEQAPASIRAYRLTA